MAPAAPQRVDGLVRSDGVQPGTDRTTRLVLVALEVQLQEGILEDVLGQVPVPQVAPQVTVQFPLVAAYQDTKRFCLSPTEAQQQILVGTAGEKVGVRHVLNFFTRGPGCRFIVRGQKEFFYSSDPDSATLSRSQSHSLVGFNLSGYSFGGYLEGRVEPIV